MNLAIIESGGKQYLVKPGSTIQIEKVVGEEGEIVKLDKVLFLSRDNDIELGKPFVPGAMLEAKITKQARSRKVLVFKYKSKSKYRRKRGHRQHYTELKVSKF